jgi:hypothetical protein
MTRSEMKNEMYKNKIETQPNSKNKNKKSTKKINKTRE